MLLAAARGSGNTVAHTGNGCRGIVMNSFGVVRIRNAYRAVRSRVAAFTHDRSGSIAVMTALALPALIGVTGLGVEVSYWYLTQRSMQNAADSAAVAAATNGTATYGAEARAAAAKYGFVDGQKNITVTASNTATAIRRSPVPVPRRPSLRIVLGRPGWCRAAADRVVAGLPWSSSLRNISTPVTVVFWVARMPTISISSPTLTMPRSMRPVTTVPRPEIDNTSSTGIRNGLSMAAPAPGCRCPAPRPACMIDGTPISRLVAFQRLSAEPVHDRGVVAGELVLLQQLAHFHLDQLQQLGVVDHVRLVQVDHNVRHADLARQQDVLARLRHRAVRGRAHQDRAVHLRRTGDHVLDVVRVPRAIHVRVVAVRRSRIPRARSRS